MTTTKNTDWWLQELFEEASLVCMCVESFDDESRQQTISSLHATIERMATAVAELELKTDEATPIRKPR